jgi:hypothetical protein
MAAETEILGVLANLVILLASITIPTYAIAVSLLGPEYAESVKRITGEKEKLEKELREQMGTGTIRLEELEGKIKKFREKEKKMKSRFNPLSLYPTVLFPNICFSLSLFSIILGIYDNNIQDFPYYLGISLIFIGGGIIILGWALVMIQKAAKETSRSAEQ